MSYAVDVYAVGIFCLSACAHKSLGVDEVTKAVNEQYPAGTPESGLRWQLSEDTAFADGSPMPHVCEHSDMRLHYLFNC